MKRLTKILSIIAMIGLAIALSAHFFGPNRVLKIVAYWVVFGLPRLLLWRFYKLSQAKNKPRNFYVGNVILYLGIAVWIPFALLKRIMGIDISVFPFRAVHLIVTSSGVLLRRSSAKT